MNAHREARKKYLVLACACDRIEFALAWRSSSKPSNPVANVISTVLPWWQVARTVMIPLLPKKLRAAAFLYRLWRSSSR